MRQEKKYSKQHEESTTQLGQDLFYQSLEKILKRKPTLEDYLEMSEVVSGQKLNPETEEEIREMYRA